MSVASDRRRSLLVAALAFLRVEPHTPALRELHSWLDNWSGIGFIIVGMERHGYWVSLRKWHGGGWTATFHRDVMLSSDGFGSGPTPWRAVQDAAWQVLKRDS